jgi:DNA-binding transcriptional MerR regulator
MFKIGDFSKFTRVSVKMLRHYDEIGLLKPAAIDSESGYRYYSADQLPRLNQIILLKDLGFTLEHVRALLDENLSPEEVKGMLRLRKAEVEQRIADERARLAQLEAELARYDQAETRPAYNVILREVPSQWMATLRQVVSEQDANIGRMFDQVEAFVSARDARAASSPMMLFHDAEYSEQNLDVEIAVPVTQPLSVESPGEGEGDCPIQVRFVAGSASMACAVYTGGYEKTAEVLSSILVWMERNDYVADGPYREVYLRFGADHAERLDLPRAFLAKETELFVTEVQAPVTKAKRGRI